MKSRKPCHKCNNPIESDRPKWSKYCKPCGSTRSRDWKREHPERAKLHGSDDASREWRERNDWNAYMKAWREQHYAEYRAQNRRHLKDLRSRSKSERGASLSAQSILIIAALTFMVLSAQGCESLPQLTVSEPTLNHFDSLLLRLTATFALAAACLRLIINDLARLILEFRRRKIEADPDVPARNRGLRDHSNED